MTSTRKAHAKTAITLSCPAKVNLVLSVGPPNEKCMHPLVSWMAAVDFSDTLSLSGAQNDKSEFDIQAAANGQPGDPQVEVDWPLESDLVFRAHALLQEHVGTSLPVNIKLRKRIPACAGLGGGSSNAAATLVAINRWFDLGLTDPTLVTLGQQLGSDVGFSVGAMLGQVSALVTGVGEQIEPLPLAQPIQLVLIFPAAACATKKVYAAFDERHQHSPSILIDPQRVRALASSLPLSPDAPWNDLADPAFAVAPELVAVSDRVQRLLDHPVHVTGSGSTLYLIAPSHTVAADWANEVVKQTGLPAVATQTLSRAP